VHSRRSALLGGQREAVDALEIRGTRPMEQSIAAGETVETVVTFENP
jgi:hypothetical protein